MTADFLIGRRRIGTGAAPYVIAEIGVNHNGDVALAEKTIAAAARSGADAVKFQVFHTDAFMSDPSQTYTYRNNGQDVVENMYDMFKRLELSPDDYRRLQRFSNEQGVDFFASACDEEACDMLAGMGVPAIKIASGDFTHLPLIRRAAGTGLPLIVSTGMADQAEIDEVVEILAALAPSRFLLMHCVSIYPAPDEEINLGRIVALQDRYRVPVGYSDHSLGPEACLGAVALGAVMLEKHFTFDRSLPGPDHSFSANPVDLAALATAARRAAVQRGAGGLDPSPGERRTRLEFRLSVVAARDLPAGTRLTEAMLGLKRPGDGLHPRHIDDLVGKTLRRNVSADAQLKLSDVE